MWCCGLKKGFCNQSALKRSVCLNGGSSFLWWRTDQPTTNHSHSSSTLHPFIVSLMMRYPPVSVGFASNCIVVMTVLLKNLFSVHFQFDLLKLETNNTRDDKMNHAWIIARWTVFLCWRNTFFDHRGEEQGWIFYLTPKHAIWTGPPHTHLHPNTSLKHYYIHTSGKICCQKSS